MLVYELSIFKKDTEIYMLLFLCVCVCCVALYPGMCVCMYVCGAQQLYVCVCLVHGVVCIFCVCLYVCAFGVRVWCVCICVRCTVCGVYFARAGLSVCVCVCVSVCVCV